jgi:hypothetical protein
MNISTYDAERILRLIDIAENESLADNEDLRLAIHVMREFPEHYQQRYEELLNRPTPVQPPGPTPVMLDLELAASVPGVWPAASGRVEHPFLDARD